MHRRIRIVTAAALALLQVITPALAQEGAAPSPAAQAAAPATAGAPAPAGAPAAPPPIEEMIVEVTWLVVSSRMILKLSSVTGSR